MRILQQICHLSGFWKKSSFFRKTHLFFQKWPKVRTLWDIFISVAFYGKSATIWSKNKFTFTSVNKLADVTWTQLANIGFKKCRKWPIWEEDFAFILLRICRKIKKMKNQTKFGFQTRKIQEPSTQLQQILSCVRIALIASHEFPESFNLPSTNWAVNLLHLKIQLYDNQK